MKQKTKNILVLTVFPALVLLCIGLYVYIDHLQAVCGCFLSGDDFVLELYRPWFSVLAQLFIVAMSVSLMIINRRHKRILFLLIPLLLCVGVLIFTLIEMDLSDSGRGKDVRVYEYEGFDTVIAIDNWQWLLGGGSAIYQSKDGVWFEYVATVKGDDGYQPLANPEDYQVTVTEDGILFEHRGLGDALFLRYVGGRFVKEVKPPSLAISGIA